MTTYNPKTIHTSQIKLSADLEGLVERLAQNVHDHWAVKRIGEGWRCGPERSDSAKQHPDLVPYEELVCSLPLPQKAYDQRWVTETIKAIPALGYEIKRR